ncbi:hypothetical protein [uncultured Tateyamaria sp.]|uniref:hypothetical protein n=1 Tax=uncultured Tateyamaria sp. TaxID=455651 RepID=UPI002628B0D5|nr:hypothetical protein [uncultured Tateyamaria sp.]
MSDTPHSLPAWYAEIPADQRSEDFHQRVGTAELLLCERDTKQLIISFGQAQDTDHPELDWPAWTDRLARQKGWSHLAILAPKDTWFRDPHLIQTLEQLRDLGFFKRFKDVALFGAAKHGGGFAALAFAPLIPSATIIAFDPQSTLRPTSVPWEDRFKPQAPTDWSLPYSDATRALTNTKRAYVAYDPFSRQDAQHVARLPAKRITPLRAVGLVDDIGIALKRLGLLDDLVIAAVAGTLDPADWYPKLRARRDLYIYRRGMEGHLAARGKDARAADFVAAFRKRTRARKAQEEQAPAPAPAPPKAQTSVPEDFPDRPEAPALGGRRWPRTLGNVWALRDEPTGFRYLSDQYEGRVMGFEERREVTLGETHPLALGIAAFGSRAGLPRPLPEDFRYHVVDEALSGRAAPCQARSHGAATQRLAAEKRYAYRTLIALSQPQAGIVADEALPESPLYQTLLQRISAARDALQGWNKGFHLDRIALSLLSGAPGTSLQDAIEHYGTVAHALRHDAAVAAGQASFPLIVTSQSAGTARDGRSEVILAEGQLDIAHPALGLIVATPTYPYPLMDDMPATLTPAANMEVDELEALAVAIVQDGGRWYCPSMREAQAMGRTIKVTFSTLAPLVLGDGPHGFALSSEGPAIAGVQVSGNEATLTLDGDLPDGPMHVTYAWGATAPTGENRFANTGAIRDAWTRPSVMQPGTPLHRYALSGRVAITRGGKA